MKYITKIKNLEQLSNKEKSELTKVSEKFKFRSNSYYNSLINWNDENDPIKNIIIPSVNELDETYNNSDASNEKKFTKEQGLEHKYIDTALILFNDVCGGYCRFCFRKRLFFDDNDDTVNDLGNALKYINKNKSINNVLITGGDPFIASKKLLDLLKKLVLVEHINFIRIGTKMLAFNPQMFLNEQLLNELEKLNKIKKIKIMNDFNHANEITEETKKSIFVLKNIGLMLYNQTPIIRGVNDTSESLRQLLLSLNEVGIIPYYFFQMRPTIGNFHYSVPIEKVITLLNDVRHGLPGILQNFKYVMSHESGKIEIIGINDTHIFMKYHRAADLNNHNKMLLLKRNKNAHWLDDYEDI